MQLGEWIVQPYKLTPPAVERDGSDIGEDGQQKRLLIVEVAGQERLADAGHLRDLGRGRRRVAGGRKPPDRDAQQLPAPLRLSHARFRRVPRTILRGAHRRPRLVPRPAVSDTPSSYLTTRFVGSARRG